MSAVNQFHVGQPIWVVGFGTGGVHPEKKDTWTIPGWAPVSGTVDGMDEEHGFVKVHCPAMYIEHMVKPPSEVYALEREAQAECDARHAKFHAE